MGARNASLAALLVAISALALLATGCGGDSSDASPGESGGPESLPLAKRPEIPIPEGLPPGKIEIEDLWEGDGAKAKRGDEVEIQYYGVHWKDGTEHANSWRYREDPTFTVGARTLLLGMNRALIGMREGGAREVLIPHNYVYYPGVPHQRLGRLEALVYRIYLLDIVGKPRS